MEHPMIRRRLNALWNKAAELEEKAVAQEEANGKADTRLLEEWDDVLAEIDSLELAKHDPEAFGFGWDSPSLPEPYPY